MPSKVYSLFLLILLFSCSRKQSRNIVLEDSSLSLGPILEIIGENLSEDASRLSSNNDEILLLIYGFPLINGTSSVLFSEYFILDNEKKKASFDVDKKLFEGETVLFVMAEVDSDISVDKIETTITQNLDSLFDSFKNLDRATQSKIIGDDDILVMREIPIQNTSPNFTFTVEGVHKIDRFRYLIKISK